MLCYELNVQRSFACWDQHYFPGRQNVERYMYISRSSIMGPVCSLRTA